MNASVPTWLAVSPTNPYDKRLQELAADHLPLHADGLPDALLVVADERLRRVVLRGVALGHQDPDFLRRVELLVQLARVDGGAVEVEDGVGWQAAFLLPELGEHFPEEALKDVGVGGRLVHLEMDEPDFGDGGDDLMLVAPGVDDVDGVLAGRRPVVVVDGGVADPVLVYVDEVVADKMHREQQAPELLSMSYDQTSPHNLNHIYKRENS